VKEDRLLILDLRSLNLHLRRWQAKADHLIEFKERCRLPKFKSTSEILPTESVGIFTSILAAFPRFFKPEGLRGKFHTCG